MKPLRNEEIICRQEVTVPVRIHQAQDHQVPDRRALQAVTLGRPVPVHLRRVPGLHRPPDTAAAGRPRPEGRVPIPKPAKAAVLFLREDLLLRGSLPGQLRLPHPRDGRESTSRSDL